MRGALAQGWAGDGVGAGAQGGAGDGVGAGAGLLAGRSQAITKGVQGLAPKAQAGLGKAGDAQPFDTAQKEEVQRLAYVAVTRAVRHCYWHVESANGEVAGAPRASAQIDGRQDFFDDLRGQ